MSNALVPGLIAAHSHRLEDLTAVAVQFMGNYPLAPLEEETVLVQSNGIAQWLKIELAKASGIAAMLNVTLPARFVWKAYRTVLGNDIPKTSPFDKDRLSWRIMRVLPELIEQYQGSEQGEFKALHNYLSPTVPGNDGALQRLTFDERKLFQLSARIADLFDQYQNYRADWLDHWTQGRHWLDSEATPVNADNKWQPILWQALVNDIGADLYWTNRAELHRRFVATAKQLTTPPQGLPKRLVVFGISSLPQQTLEVLDALKGCMQIVLCVHNPCMHYWANIVDGKEALKEALKHATQQRLGTKAGMSEETHDDELHLHAHPLLASWGKQGRDYIHLLDLYDETLEKQAAFDAMKFEIFDEAPATNMLHQLQSDVLNLRPVHETRQTWPAQPRPDGSIQFHICHSIQREVEVLHDQLLAAFERDPALEPRSIMVMVPDVNAYAPHIDAVFGRFDYNDSRRIPYTIADQGQRHQQPLMVALELLLSLEQLRVNQADVLSLLGVPAIQERFNLSAQELVQVQQWFDAAGARWGLEGEHRAQFGMPENEKTNSWWFALERMVLGYAMGRPNSDEQQRWQHIEPYHEVGGLSADAAGKLGVFIEVLSEWRQFVCGEHSLTDWVAGAEALLERVFTPVNDDDLVLLSKLREQLTELLAVANEGGFTAPLAISTFRESWLARVDQPNLNQRFLAGSVNFATLMPMRAIPFQHIYVLGMDDEAYPRRQSSIDFDLMRTSYRPGDRSRRDDDRYLFLEALLSARTQFYVSWVGRSAQDNSEWPPSVLVSQLREHLVKGWCPNHVESKQFLAALTTEHKLQAFHPSYMTANTGLFTYAAEWQAARSISSAAEDSAALKPWQAEQGQRLQLNLRNLMNFMRQPAQPFFNERLNTYLSSEEAETHDSETFVLDSLQQWQLSSDLLARGVQFMREQLHAGSFVELADIEPLQPAFSPIFARLQREGALGAAVISESIKAQALERVAEPLVEMSKSLVGWRPIADTYLAYESMPVNGLTLVVEERATQLFQNEHGEVLQVYVTASERKSKHEFLPYLKHLLLSAVRDKKPELGAVTTYACFRKGNGGSEAVSLPPINASAARFVLNELLALYVQSLSAPAGVVGELALDWLDAYLKSRSGSAPLKNGSQKTAPAPEQEARLAATAEVLKKRADKEPNGQAEWPYAARIERSVEAMLESADFATYIEKLYAPLRRLAHGQEFSTGMPEPLYAQSDSEQHNSEQQGGAV